MPCFPFSKQDAILVAAPDGTLYQVDISSGRILWSFPSGAPIYDSHQAVNLEDDEHNSSRQQQHNKFYIDCGDDWQLYIHAKNTKAEVSKYTPVNVSLFSMSAIHCSCKSLVCFIISSRKIVSLQHLVQLGDTNISILFML